VLAAIDPTLTGSSALDRSILQLLGEAKQIPVRILNEKVSLAVKDIVVPIPVILEGLTHGDAGGGQAPDQIRCIGAVDGEIQPPSTRIIKRSDDPES